MTFSPSFLNRHLLFITSAIFLIVTALLVPAQTFAAESSTQTAKPVGKPVLLVVDVADSTQKTQPTIAGLAPQNTTVDIYLNDKFVGNTGVSKNTKVIGDFAFRLPKPLAYGSYKVTAVTRHVDNNKKTTYSAVSMPLTLRIPTHGVKDVRVATKPSVEQAQKAVWPAVSEASSPRVETTTIPASEAAQNSENAQILAENQVQTDESQGETAKDAPQNDQNASLVPDLPLTTLQIVGWVALLTAAGLFVYQARRHRQDIDMSLEEPLDTEEQNSAKNTEEKPQ